jgi:hypothetical protein
MKMSNKKITSVTSPEVKMARSVEQRNGMVDSVNNTSACIRGTIATDLPALTCPVCGKLLTSEEYKHATEEIRVREEEKYLQQIAKDRCEFEEQIENERKLFREKLDNTNRNNQEQLKILREQLGNSYKNQFEELRKNYEDLDLQRQRNSKEFLEEKIGEYKKRIDVLTMQIVQFQEQSQELKKNALADARTVLQGELHSKDIEIRERDEQIRRCKGTIEELKEQMSSTQSERKGEAGEQDLLKDLIDRFKEDKFTRQTRGISQGDIIQRIKTPSGALLKIPIVYDNKEVARVTRREIEKQQYYKEQEGIDYLLLVTPNVPRSIKNGILGKKEGVTLVRRDIVLEVAEHIRNAIIEICKCSESKNDQDTKQARIYEYITSREFCRKLESVEKDNSEMVVLQDKEEKDHQTMWKRRKAIIQRSKDTYTAVSSEIDSTIHGQSSIGASTNSKKPEDHENDDDDEREGE